MRGEARPEAHDFPAVTAPGLESVGELDAAVAECRACPRLVAWREEVARVKRRAFRDWEYWARPVPGFGPADARLAIVGLAPAAHGGNRTGRIFTGDPRATRCTPRCTTSGWPAGRPPRGVATGWSCTGCASPCRCTARRPPTGPPAPSGTPADRGSPASWTCCARTCARSWCSAPSPGRRCCPCSPTRVAAALAAAGLRPRRRGADHRLRHPTRAAPGRRLPPESAQHVHPYPHPRHAPRRAAAGRRPRRTAAPAGSRERVGLTGQDVRWG